MPNTVTLKISNCLDCPHHKIVPAVAFDSFDMVDEDVICLKSEGSHKSRYETHPHKAVTISNRPWQTRKECSVPVWCPLKKKK